MRFSTLGITLITLGLAVTQCAKKRPTEKLFDGDGNRYQKASLLGDDQWMYKATVTKTSSEGGFVFVGQASNLQVGRFDFGRDRLSFYNTVTPYQDKNKENLPELLNSWEIEHSDYRLAESDGKVLNKEEENDKINWDQKKFFKIDWTSQKRDFLGDASDCFDKIDDRLVEGSQEVTPEHFSFTVEQVYELKYVCNSYANIKRRGNSGNFTYTIQVKHSFAPMPKSDYEPLVYKSEFDEKRPRYGFFETVVDRFNDQTGRFEKKIVANRWNPKKEHTIYFAEDFPEDYKWIYNDKELGIEKVTNDMFAKNGLEMRIHFKQDPKVKFGDVRYSFVKFVEKLDDQSPLGYGPSDVNPITGEILRSDTIIWTAPLKEYVRRIRDFEKEEPTLETQSLFQEMQKVLAQAVPEKFKSDSEVDVTVIKDFLKTAHKFDSRGVNYKADQLDPEATATDRDRARYELQKIISSNLFANPSYANYTSRDPFNYGVNNFDRQIDDTKPLANDAFSKVLRTMEKAGNQMPAESLALIKRLQVETQNHFYSNGDVQNHDQLLKIRVKDPTTVHSLEPYLASIPEVLGKKSEREIVDTILYRVAVHEFGHNLNLRHNFYGSVDYLNFPEAKPQIDRFNKPLVGPDGTVVMSTPLSASVMDYLSLTDEYNLEHNWEAYDEAALTYAYSSGKIDLTDVDVQHAADGSVQTVKRAQPRIFLYCTDEHRGWFNPFCNAYDIGSTPSEVAMSMIKNYARAYTARNTPYLRPYWDTTSYQSAVAADMMNPLKFLALYSERGRWLTRMTPENQFENPREYSRINQAIQEDMRRAVTLLGAFYASVRGFDQTSRPYLDNIDGFTGEVTRIGILPDKLYALMALSGSNPMSILNQGQANEINFLNYLGEGTELGSVARQTLKDVAIENLNIPFRGFESFGRSLFVSTASVTGDILDDKYIERMAVYCYSPEAMKKVFGINTSSYYTAYDEQSQEFPPLDEQALTSEQLRPLVAGFARLGGTTKALKGSNIYPVNDANRFPPGAANAAVRAAIVRVGGYYYVAPMLANNEGYAYEYMAEIVRNGATTSNTQYLGFSKALFDTARYGFNQPCYEAN